MIHEQCLHALLAGVVEYSVADVSREALVHLCMDAPASGRRLEILTIVDDFSREAVNIVVEHAISGRSVTRFLDYARELIADWRRDYNETRPHSALGYETPAVFVASHRRQSDSLEEAI